MKIKIVCFFFMVLLGSKASSCDCKTYRLDSLQKLYFKKSDVVFLGEIIKVDTINLNTVFNVYEYFKGKCDRKVLKITLNSSSCSFLPNSKGLWLIYCKKETDSTFSVSQCGPSRSNINPIIYSVNTIPILPKKRKKEDLLEYSIKYTKMLQDAIVEWYNELYKLRNPDKLRLSVGMRL